MGVYEAFRSAVYKEPVMVWSLMIYASGRVWALHLAWVSFYLKNCITVCSYLANFIIDNSAVIRHHHQA